jgi:hypothetical protein
MKQERVTQVPPTMGSPYRGRLSNQLVEQLRTMARNKNCLDGFEKWVKTHILP